MSILSAGLAGSFSLIFVYPVDFARTRLGKYVGKAANVRQFSSLFDFYKKILANDVLYQGFFVPVLGILTYRAFYFGYKIFNLEATMLVKALFGEALKNNRKLHY